MKELDEFHAELAMAIDNLLSISHDMPSRDLLKKVIQETDNLRKCSARFAEYLDKEEGIDNEPWIRKT